MPSDNVEVFGYILQYSAAAIACCAAFYTAMKANVIADKASTAASEASEAAKNANKVSEEANKIAAKNLSASVELEIIKFREQWIQRLREEMAGYAGLQLEGRWKAEHLRRANLHSHKIDLHMNPDDDLYKKLSAQINILQIRKILKMSDELTVEEQAKEQGIEPEVLKDVKDEKSFNLLRFMDISTKILKREWERLKEDLRDYNAKNK